MKFAGAPRDLKTLDGRIYTNKGQLLAKKVFLLNPPQIKRLNLAAMHHTKGRLQSIELELGAHVNPNPSVFELNFRLSHPQFQAEGRSRIDIVRIHCDSEFSLDNLGASAGNDWKAVGKATLRQRMVWKTWDGTHAWPKKSHFRVLLSIRDEWPLLVTFQLPSKGPTKTTKIPFTAKLAPLDLAKR